MLLEEVSHFNRLTPEMRKELEEKVRSFGKVVRYQFDIARDNPDPEKYGGIKTIYPSAYTLDPAVLNITDKNEKRPNESRSKKIGLVMEVDTNNKPIRFQKIRVFSRDKGILSLNIEASEEDFHKAMLLELHPKQKGGAYADDKMHQVFFRIDEKKYAEGQRKERTLRLKALNAVADMGEKELKEFADAMTWEHPSEIEVLRNQVEVLAESDPEFFNDLIAGKNIEYQAAVRRAIDMKVIAYDPADNGFTWGSNNQPITKLAITANKTHIEAMSEWLQTGGQKAEEVYKKMRSLLDQK